MDPNETLRMVNEAACANALKDLADWLLKGGFMPEGRLEGQSSDWRPYDKLWLAVDEALRTGDRSVLEPFRHNYFG